MITAEQANALTPGTKVWVQTYTHGGSFWTPWVVYQPAPEQRWDSDPNILNYIQELHSGLSGYLFRNQLHKYSLTQRF